MNNISHKAFCALILLVFTFCVVKNISYPLFWNDESETAMYAKRILEYGFPKVDDGKNLVYMLYVDKKIAVHETTGAYKGALWGTYYYAAFAEFFAGKFDDIYDKTGVFRIFFAIPGILGLIILVNSIYGLIRGREFLLFFGSFFLIELT